VSLHDLVGAFVAHHSVALILPTNLTAEEIYGAAAAAGARPDPLLTISQWADRYRWLSQRASAEHGRWRTERTPYLREIMDCLSPSSLIERVAFMNVSERVTMVKDRFRMT
jgi:phage terminase large subunit GpA-like protein